MEKPFVDTIIGRTLNIDMSRALDGTRDMISLSTDLFLIAIRMREADNLGDPASLRKLSMYYLDQFKKNCKVIGIGDESANDALYAMVALIDETVLSSPGACRDFWFAHPLQLDLFGDNIAGEEFYRKLDKLLGRPDTKKDVIEMYYLCMSLGFEGKYKIFNPEELPAIIAKVGGILTQTRKRTGSGISPHGNRNNYLPGKGKRHRGGVPLWAGALAALGACVVTWFVLLGLSLDGLGKIMKVVEGMNLR